MLLTGIFSVAKSQRQHPSPDQYFRVMRIDGLTTRPRSLLFAVEGPSRAVRARRPVTVRRRITAEAGRGLEKLGHAIEYLTDEFVLDGCACDGDRGRLQAIQLLASLNRQIYFSCGIEPSIRERLHSLFRRYLNKLPSPSLSIQRGRAASSSAFKAAPLPENGRRGSLFPTDGSLSRG